MNEHDLVSEPLLPFQHEDIEHVKRNIDLAKELRDSGEPKDILGAVLVCINIADYLAEFIANGLVAMTTEAMKQYYFGVVIYEPGTLTDRPIKTSMNTIRQYDFAQKTKLMQILGKINENRNHIAHKIVKRGATSVPDTDKKINELFVLTNKLIAIANIMQLGFPPANILSKI